MALDPSLLNSLYSYNNLFTCQTFFQFVRSRLWPQILQPQDPSSLFQKSKRLLLEVDPFAVPSKLPAEYQTLVEDIGLSQGPSTIFRAIFVYPKAYLTLALAGAFVAGIKTLTCRNAFSRSMLGLFWLPLGIAQYGWIYKTREDRINKINDQYEINDPNFRAKDIEQILWREKHYMTIFRELFRNKLNQVLEVNKHNISHARPALLPTKLIKEPNLEKKDQPLSLEEMKKKEEFQKQILQQKKLYGCILC